MTCGGEAWLRRGACDGCWLGLRRVWRLLGKARATAARRGRLHAGGQQAAVRRRSAGGGAREG
uniref:Uncharacterized protein n=1 Tax=Arundo donax TaxID=35708 RepID=A0A0A9G4N3_ARUDO